MRLFGSFYALELLHHIAYDDDDGYSHRVIPVDCVLVTEWKVDIKLHIMLHSMRKKLFYFDCKTVSTSTTEWVVANFCHKNEWNATFLQLIL